MISLVARSLKRGGKEIRIFESHARSRNKEVRKRSARRNREKTSARIRKRKRKITPLSNIYQFS